MEPVNLFNTLTDIRNTRTHLYRGVIISAFIVASIWFGGSTTFAQDSKIEPAAAIQSGLQAIESQFPGATYSINSRTGLLSSINGIREMPIQNMALGPSSPDAPNAKLEPKIIVEEFFAQRGTSLFALVAPRQDIEVVDQRPDPNFGGLWVVRVQQQVNGVPIFGAGAALVVQPNVGVMSVTSGLIQRPNVQTEPTISTKDASTVAHNAYNKLLKESEGLSTELGSPPNESPKIQEPKLMIFDPALLGVGDGTSRLSWHVKVGDFVFFVDALKGDVHFRYFDHQTALVRKTYDLHQGETFPGTLVLDEASGPPGGGVSRDAQLAHKYAGFVYKYYWLKFARDSYDDNDGIGPNGGAAIVSHVNYGSRENAYWDPNINAMIYGPGYAQSLDIVGHEITHAVVTNEADLIYFSESGALNEFFADLFGVLIEGNYEQQNWLIGENLPGFQPPNSPLRDMRDPHNGSFTRSSVFSQTNRGQPDHYDEIVKSSDKICESTFDAYNGCVHFNSGIYNKAASLIADGGTHHGITVSGIGRPKLALIFYRALVVKFSPTTDMKAGANHIVESCHELSAGPWVDQADCDEVTKALKTVGVYLSNS